MKQNFTKLRGCIFAICVFIFFLYLLMFFYQLNTVNIISEMQFLLNILIGPSEFIPYIAVFSIIALAVNKYISSKKKT